MISSSTRVALDWSSLDFFFYPRSSCRPLFYSQRVPLPGLLPCPPRPSLPQDLCGKPHSLAFQETRFGYKYYRSTAYIPKCCEYSSSTTQLKKFGLHETKYSEGNTTQALVLPGTSHTSHTITIANLFAISDNGTELYKFVPMNFFTVPLVVAPRLFLARRHLLLSSLPLGEGMFCRTI